MKKKLRIIKYNPIDYQKEFHDTDDVKHLHLSGGYGCIQESTLLETKSGKRAAGDIKDYEDYLSQRHSSLIVARGTAPYPKGKANLYRVVHTHGEFVVTEFHRVFCGNYTYAPVHALRIADRLPFWPEASLGQLRRSYVYDHESYLEYVRHLKSRHEGYQDDYAMCTHQCGRQPRQAIGNDQAFVQLSNGVQEFCPLCDDRKFLHKDVLSGQGYSHSRRDQYCGPLSNDHLMNHSRYQLSDEANCVEASFVERAYAYNQQLKQSALKCEPHHITLESLKACHPYESCSCTKTIVKAIEKVKFDWFWDLHVFGTNNYIASGISHHNSGKTRSLCMKAIKLLQENKPHSIGLFCPSVADYKKDVLPTMTEILDDNGVTYEYHQTDKWFKFPWSPGVIQVFGCERKIRGPNLAAACINEVTLISFERFKEIIGRVRIKGAKIPQIATSGTPEGIAHWLYEFHVEHSSPTKRIIYADTRKNPYLSSDYIQTLEEAYDKIMLDAYLRGMFVNMNSGRFYYAYDPARNDNVDITRINGLEVHVSLDFNVAPMCATLWHIIPVKDEFGITKLELDGSIQYKAIAFDQIEILDGADTEKMCDALLARGFMPDYTTIYPDPAGRARSTKGPPDIEILKRRGFYKIKVKLTAPEFRKRQLNTNNLLEKGRVIINPRMCPGIKKDFMAVEQDQATFEKIKSNPKLTHFSDGFDYMADHVFPFSGHKPESRSIKFR